jgi:steroid delta-isomerase-like uncharacterized protein
VEQVEAYLQAWNDHDGHAVVRTLADGGTYVDPTLPGPISGQELRNLVEALANAFPDLAFAVEALLPAGDRVVVQWRMTGTNTGTLPGLAAPTGATCDLPGVDVITVGPDGIASVVGYFDQLTFLGQLGVEVQVGPPAAG